MRKHHLDRLRHLRRQLDAALGEAVENERVEGPAAETPGAWRPPVDIVESEREFRVEAELPGVLRSDIELSVEGARLELAGRRRAPGADGRFQLMEGRYGPFRRILSLGEDVDESAIEANLERGVLVIRIPKRAPGLGRRKIEVDWERDDG